MTDTASRATRVVAASGRRRRHLGGGPRAGTIVAFLTPFFLPFVLFYLVPIGYAIWQSFRVVRRTGGQYGTSYTTFGGFHQYVQVFHNTEFWSSIERIGLFGVVQVPVMLFVALIMALLLDSPLLRLRSFFRIAAFMPYAVPGVIAAIMWSFLYSPQLSPVVEVLKDVGLTPNFLGPGAVLWSTANVSTWLWTGYNMLILFSALQSIPQELYEAARLDGASNWAIAWRIKVPIIAPSIILTTVFSIIGTLQLYAEPAVLRQISSNISSTYTPNMLAYAVASGNNYQQAAAISVVIAVVTFVLSFGFMRLTTRRAGL
ncbi:carbohydrate ABC transporter membrane protein 1, CUT1 family [Actinacidiphila yanglinensis]|uniref:Carbohydrate ABC transporter membrane protein 1, CUT1 family n=1 Tax=Actinacidiphila yanglinensis TaxID=310779 RepID=A0A1H6C8U1_9ACTN|nr:sugar ABC transporter permease [Actinacidiphila yanglinensis]SEG69313.1 carbohydrate ABC transporter membrane protein 1, CUT1 family [Actinacidiphila yanglinensis]